MRFMSGAVRMLRRRVSQIVRGIPGGRLALSAGRLPIQVVQFVKSRFTPHARIPGWFRRAHTLLYTGRCERAIALYDCIIALDPVASSSFLRRGLAHHMLGRSADAFRDCETALSLPGLPIDDKGDAHLLLATLLAERGELDLAIPSGFRGRWWRTRRTEPPPLPESGPLDPDVAEALVETYCDLAEKSLNFRNDWAIARELYRRADAVRERYRAQIGDPGDTLVLDGEWTRNIGHQAFLDYVLKMKDLGWTRWKNVVLLAPPSMTANEAYLECFRPRVELVREERPHAAARHRAKALGFRVAGLLRLPDGSTPYLPEALGIIQEEWERQGRGTQLAPPPDLLDFGRRQLKAMGVPDGAWFVGLHVRSASFYAEDPNSPQTHRNARIESYVPAIEEIARRGGWVFRMGDRNMPPLPSVRGGIDYARSRFKSDRMDVFLCAMSRFFIGVASGLGNPPGTFGVPCLMANWVSNALPFFSRNDLFLPKLLRRQLDGSILTFDEWLSRPVRDACYSGVGIRNMGLKAVDNTPEELRAGASAMLDLLEGKLASTPESRAREAAFDALARAHGQRGFARVVPDFLQRHAQLLG